MNDLHVAPMHTLVAAQDWLRCCFGAALVRGGTGAAALADGKGVVLLAAVTDVLAAASPLSSTPLF